MAGLLWLNTDELRRAWDAWLLAASGDKVFTADKLIRSLRDEEAELRDEEADDASPSTFSWGRLQEMERMIAEWAREDA